MNILLINDTAAHANWGAQASIFALENILLERIPGSELRKLSWDWIRTELRVPRFEMVSGWQIRPNVIPHLGFLVSKLTRPVRIYPRVRDEFEWYAEQWAQDRMGPVARDYIDAVQWADVVVYNGENSLYRNTKEGCRSIFLLYLARTRLDTAACSINHTVHITDVRPIMNAMVHTVLPALDLVTARESRSHRLLLELGVENARQSADPVFCLNEQEAAGSRVDEWLENQGLKSGGYACLSASGLPASEPKNGYDGAVTDLVRVLSKCLGLPVVLMARDPDCQFLKEVAARSSMPYFGPEHHFSELWPLLRKAAVLVTGHYHYVIIAALSGCPFVPLTANNHKMAGICEQLDWYRTEPFDITWLSPIQKHIANEAANLIERRAELSDELKSRALQLRELAGSTGDWVIRAARPQSEVVSEVPT